MPIHLNLLAEAQAAEELRRRDPVKRAIWIAAVLASLMLVWSSSLQLKAMLGSGEVSRIQNQMNSHTNEYKAVQNNQAKLEDTKHKLQALRKLSDCRFLQGSLLNALQQTTIDDVQLNHFRTEQIYSITEGTKPRTNDNRVILGKPATVAEKIVVTLDASDISTNPGDQVNVFKSTLSRSPYFRELLGRTNAISLQKMAPPELIPAPNSTIGRPCVLFTLEARTPEVVRSSTQ